jgi:GTP cyclohydrolase I
MLAFDNPVFVEDMVRNVVERLSVDPRVQAYSVEAVNDESIHNHAAFARASFSRQASDAIAENDA